MLRSASRVIVLRTSAGKWYVLKSADLFRLDSGNRGGMGISGREASSWGHPSGPASLQPGDARPARVPCLSSAGLPGLQEALPLDLLVPWLRTGGPANHGVALLGGRVGRRKIDTVHARPAHH